MNLADEFTQEFKGKGLHGRFTTFRRAVELLADRKDILVLETGSIRDENDFRGGGQSTLIFVATLKFQT